MRVEWIGEMFVIGTGIGCILSLSLPLSRSKRRKRSAPFIILLSLGNVWLVGVVIVLCWVNLDETTILYQFRKQHQLLPTSSNLRSTRPDPNQWHGASIVEKLSNVSTPYFIYNSEEISQLKKHVRFDKRYVDRYGHHYQKERLIFNHLRYHRLRTKNASMAQVYIVSVPLTQRLLQFKNAPGAVGDIFAPLFRHPIFQQTSGHNHLFITQVPSLFSYCPYHLKRYAQAHYNLVQSYSKLWNVTVAMPFDHRGSFDAYRTTKDPCFQEMLQCSGVPMTRSSFSINFQPEPGFPFHHATYDNFHNSTYFLFHHSRSDSEFFCESTWFRNGWLNDTKLISALSSLPQPSSVGLEVSQDEWKRHYESSKFCLVIRGDNPSSKALLRAVQVGCIPVVISDTIQDYAPVFASVLPLSQYSVLIPESDFVANPTAALVDRLLGMTELEIQDKIQSLAVAQRILVLVHPESLFIPAILHEMKERTAPERLVQSNVYPYGNRVQTTSLSRERFEEPI